MEVPDNLRDYIVNPYLELLENMQPQCLEIKSDPNNVFNISEPVFGTTLRPRRSYETGEIIDFEEIQLEDPDSRADNSMSLQRAPDASGKGSSVRGSSTNYPFWPGGFEEEKENVEELIAEEGQLLTLAPGFTHAISSSAEGIDEALKHLKIVEMDFTDLIRSNPIYDLWAEKRAVQKPRPQVLKVSTAKDITTVETKWAVEIDTRQAIPTTTTEPALVFPFKLDNFQKHAIHQLEDHNHVFVAAHTSAGKTAVAEYAIALSLKHHTKAIYTSPIKALSNQKYRDFKKTFKDVGLITGDVQIDSDASCLIMTTEILRSMLYCGSEIARDIEYVIFDEVHYITDADRGHVWEETLILLPANVTIVMLSATVPNTLEFASWVGQTKKKKVYVVSTLKRPIPLKHYLYVPFVAKNKEEIHLILDENGKFHNKGHMDAVALKEATSAKIGRKLTPNQEKTMWEKLVGYLRKTDKLPVVAFTLSRKRCDMNAESMRGCDLCTNKEKGIINDFFKRCLQTLKPPDRALPQVQNLQYYLERGYGVHHSGILPILKEIVEMLFQCGLVKLLFATETFAMGVNMPARTVIFDSDRKFDGTAVRNLYPAEYTQMAGRAGRRGLDENGTVILICKSEKVPDIPSLQGMMLGKPMRLESQFKLTYAMILNLLRVERVSVVDMMSHSYREFHSQQKLPENMIKLREVQKEFAQLPPLEDNLQPLCEFYSVASDYFGCVDRVNQEVFKHPEVKKKLQPGRLVVITKGSLCNNLAVILTLTEGQRKETELKVAVLGNPQVEQEDEKEDAWHRLLSLATAGKIHIPDNVAAFTVLPIKLKHIVEIVNSSVKIQPATIIQNWEQKQIERFKDAPLGPSSLKLVADLNNFLEGTTKVEFVNMYENIPLSVIDDKKELTLHKQKLSTVLRCTKVSNFRERFRGVFERKLLEQRLQHLKYITSKDNMTLYPDYCNKLEVLREIRYIDEQNNVTMKGRVACEMGSNELIITEIIFRNIISNLEAAEIAALLSGLVFQAKTESTAIPTVSLKKGIAEVEAINDEIFNLEQKHRVSTSLDAQAKPKLNFGLVEVVYEWGRNKPFAEIKELTDVQEGIIVRCIQQLHEILLNIKDASRVFGDPVLHAKMEDVSNAIKRDIVFAASLYTQKDIELIH
ncbi:SKI2 subunit of superkiller complex protein [Lutzomyia longipalpis]|nr:SKI2 subunit of superkiller complex protein [Lutzomyia longipalpis]XP_055695180.1 SKI2 subunit of superkiller complex protein [Lutzomyia longipalpis]